MAIIKFGATVVGVRGTIDGITYSAGKSGPWARGWGRGANQRTTPQTTQRNRQSSFAAQWRAMTAVQQAAWNTWAALPGQNKTNSLGVTYSVSGFDWFVALNGNLQAAGDPGITAVPVLAVPAAPLAISATVRSDVTGGNSNVTFNAADPNLGMRAPIFCQLVNSIGRTVGNPRDRLIIGTPIVGSLAIFVTTPIRTKYGAILIGQRAFFKTMWQNAEGRRSAPTTVATNVI
jgi:hypothetical protein